MNAKKTKKPKATIPTPRRGARYSDKDPRSVMKGEPRIVEVVAILTGLRSTRCKVIRTGREVRISFEGLATRFALVRGAE